MRLLGLPPFGSAWERKTVMSLKLVGPYWVAPIFAAFISALVLISFFGLRPHSYEAGFPAFLCFLPMAFYMATAAQAASQKQVRDLQQRIEQLEAQAAH